MDVEVAEQMIALTPLPLPTADDVPRGRGRAGEGFRLHQRARALSRANRSDMTIFVNGRWVQDRGLNAAVLQAYHTLLMVGRFPLCIIRVELNPEDVDVNVHPAKTEVRFRNSDVIFRVVQRAVRRTLIDHAPIPQVQPSTPVSAWQPSFDTHEVPSSQLARLEQLRSLAAGEASRRSVIERSCRMQTRHRQPSAAEDPHSAVQLPISQPPTANH